MYEESKQMRQDSSHGQASAPAGQNTGISPEVWEVLHMLEVIELKQPANSTKR
ncbi:MAG: hypothetical protein OER56_01110 [Hyphomicrobiales bacterium]|nr:hypothetical protein [Hyphomicrobiales bacterium]